MYSIHKSKFNLYYFLKRRYIVLTNKNLYSFKGKDDNSECTMNLNLSKCLNVEIADKQTSKKINHKIFFLLFKYFQKDIHVILFESKKNLINHSFLILLFLLDKYLSCE